MNELNVSAAAANRGLADESNTTRQSDKSIRVAVAAANRRLADDSNMARKADKSIRVAVAGCGRWGINYLRVLQQIPGCRLAGACDPDPRADARIPVSNPPVSVFRTTRAMLTALNPDAVVVATPAAGHFAVAAEALEAGAHVLVEKPLATNSRDAAALVKLSRRAGRTLMVGHIFHYHNAMIRLHAMIRRGELGRLRYLYSVRTNLGPIRDDVDVLWDLAAHDVSVMIHLAGGVPVSVTASGQNYIRGGIADVAFATLYFPRNRVIGHLQVSWLDPRKVRRLTVIGTKSMAEFDDVSTQEPLRVYDRGVDRDKVIGDFGQFHLMLRDGDIAIPRVAGGEPLKAECAHFVECARTGRKPVTDGNHGLAVVRVLEALSASLKSRGKPIRVRR
jgi:predicted dehydrogenase